MKRKLLELLWRQIVSRFGPRTSPMRSRVEVPLIPLGSPSGKKPGFGLDKQESLPIVHGVGVQLYIEMMEECPQE